VRSRKLISSGLTMLLFVGKFPSTGIAGECTPFAGGYLRVVEWGYECPTGLSIFGAKRYDATGTRRLMVFISWSDQSISEDQRKTVYMQIVRGPKTGKPDEEGGDTRYDIEICAWSDSVQDPHIHQLAGNSSMSVCCSGGADPDGSSCPPIPFDFPLPTPNGWIPPSPAEAEYEAISHLLDLLRTDLPWRKKWRYEHEAVMHLASPLREPIKQELIQALNSALANAPSEMPSDAEGLLLYPDGTVVPALPSEGPTDIPPSLPPLPEPRSWLEPQLGFKRYQHAIAVFKGPVNSWYCSVRRWHCEHSAAWAFRRYGGWGSFKEAWYNCNHGRCPWDASNGMRWWCAYQSWPDRYDHVHSTPCYTLYDPSSSLYGHNCNDDTTREYASVRYDYHWGSGWVGYPCLDTFTHHNYPHNCW